MGDGDGGTFLSRAFKLSLLVGMVMVLAARARGVSVVNLILGTPAPAVFDDIRVDDAIKSGKPVIVEYTASWCGSCKKMNTLTWTHPQVVQWVDLHAHAVQIDIDQDSSAATKNDVRVVPTVILYDNGKLVDRFSGYMPPDRLLTWLRERVD